MPALRKSTAGASPTARSAPPIRVQVGDEATQRALDAQRAAVAPVLASPLPSGIHVRGIALVGGVPLRVTHKLGRMPAGLFPTHVSTPAMVADTAKDADTVTLVSTVTVTIDVWVF